MPFSTARSISVASVLLRLSFCRKDLYITEVAHFQNAMLARGRGGEERIYYMYPMGRL